MLIVTANEADPSFNPRSKPVLQKGNLGPKVMNEIHGRVAMRTDSVPFQGWCSFLLKLALEETSRAQSGKMAPGSIESAAGDSPTPQAGQGRGCTTWQQGMT